MATFNNGESLASVRTKINDAIDKIDGNATISNDISVGGNITVTGTVDGRDVAADGTKLDGIEASATADQTGAEIKALYEAEADTNAFTDAEQTKLSGIEASADVTDTANVTAAGALMDSELTSEASVKALDQGVATTDSPTFAGVDITGTLTSDGVTVDGDVKLTDISPAIILSENDTTDVNTRLGNYGGDFSITTVNDSDVYVANRLTVDHATGDVSLYEDTGTTAKFFWDASAERLGIGTSSPDKNLHIEAEPPVFRMTNLQGTSSLGLSMGKIEWETRDSSAPGVIAHIDVVDSNNFGTTFDMAFATGQSGSAIERMRITSTGNVGIGVTDPVGRLEVKNSGDDNGFEFLPAYSSNINLMNSYNRNTNTYYPLENRASYFMFKNGTSEAMRIDSSGNVGIGTNSPDYELHVADTDSFAVVAIQASNTSNSHVFFGDTDDVDVGRISYDHSIDSMSFRVNTAEAMRIDSSGNLLVSKTTNDSTVVGAQLNANGTVIGVSDGVRPAIFNRKTSDGDIISLRKDGTTVGSIGVAGGNNLQIASTATDHAGLAFGTHVVAPLEANADSDGTIDLGSGAARFKDLYLSGGVYLGGTGASNLLDDYEEGTFTPTMTGGVTGTASGSYTKIGNTVHIRINLYRPTDITSSTDIEIGGLPFTSSNLGYRQICNILMRYYNLDEKIVSGYGIEANTTTGKIVIFDDSGSDYQYLQNSAGSSSFGAIRITGSYQTDS